MRRLSAVRYPLSLAAGGSAESGERRATYSDFKNAITSSRCAGLSAKKRFRDRGRTRAADRAARVTGDAAPRVEDRPKAGHRRFLVLEELLAQLEGRRGV